VSLYVCVFQSSENNQQEELFDQILLGQLDFPSPYWDNITDSAKVWTADNTLLFMLLLLTPPSIDPILSF